jgi:2-iminobutanoate/2-iminopropanoate deaminase
MKREAVFPPRGPKPVGPYSPAVTFGELVFVSGQGPMNPDTGLVETGDVVNEFKLAMANVRLLLEAAGSSMDRVLKVTLYLADMDDFSRINESYKTFFKEPYPARSTIQAARLPLGISVEVDVISARG